MKAAFCSTNKSTWRPRGKLAPTAQSPGTGSLAAQFYNSPEWHQLRATILTALQDHPEACESLHRALQNVPLPEAPHAPAR